MTRDNSTRVISRGLRVRKIESIPAATLAGPRSKKGQPTNVMLPTQENPWGVEGLRIGSQ